ncbi:hypothetical protein D6D29_10774 [Aureobasidium pullulans]|nr:hypothetical protein D6D29_10774 [Aureobasidium pullulans]
MLASTCIAHASSSERITQLSRGASKEDSSNKAIRICELRGGAYYRAFILGLRDTQPFILAFCARSSEVLDSFVKVLHLLDFSTSLQDSEQKEELEVSTAIVDNILRSAELSDIEGILEANFGMGCCVILSQIGDSNLLRLSRPVIGSARTSVVSPYTLGFERSTS